MNTETMLGQLTDSQVRDCLGWVVKELTIREPVYEILFQEERTAKQALSDSLEALRFELPIPELVDEHKRVLAARRILVELAKGPFKSDVERWLTDRREMLADPITWFAVAGLILLLSTDVELNYSSDSRAKSKIKVNVRKRSISEDTIKRIVGLS